MYPVYPVYPLYHPWRAIAAGEGIIQDIQEARREASGGAYVAADQGDMASGPRSGIEVRPVTRRGY